MKDHRLYFKAIHVIESLDEGHTGRRLFEDLEPICAFTSPRVTAHFWSVQTRAEFLDRLRLIAEQSRSEAESPILHIETHGSMEGDGIVLSSGEFLEWTDLKGPLTAINEVSQLNLLVVLAACNGEKLYEIIRPSDRAPVLAVIGPKRVIYASEIEQATRTFYQILFSQRDVMAAWRAMNGVISSDQESFSLVPAAYLFRLVMHHYFENLCSQEALIERERGAVGILQEKGLAGANLEFARQLYREHVRDHPHRFQERKDHFFFCDLYPENDERFDVTLEECLSLSGT